MVNPPTKSKHIDAVSLEVIKKNICTRAVCLANNNPHRHSIEACKEHPYCVVDPLEPEIQTEMQMPIPFPGTRMAGPKEHDRQKDVFRQNFISGVAEH